jgi:hypothetical protein
MKTRTVVETYDKTRFDSKKAAYNYLENLLYNKAGRIAHKLIQKNKYTEVIDFIVANLDDFKELITIQQDMTMDTEPEEE